MQLNFYKDAACTDLFVSVNAPIVTFTSISTPVQTFTYNGKSYRYYDATNGGNISGVPITDHTPILDYRLANLPANSKLYMKNGLRVTTAQCTASSLRFEGLGWHTGFPAMASNNSVIDANNKPIVWAWSIDVNGTIYIGFNRAINAKDPWSGVISPQCFIEESFWLEAQATPYDYGTRPDSDGGQGTGDITHTGVGRSAVPSDVIPTGGHGLHVYVITGQGYTDLQGYLWGEDSTIAKSLWQKFQNKTHNPSACVVGCFKLPTCFMPSSTQANGIAIAGLRLPVANAYEISPGVSTAFIKFDPLEPPFKSFLDYVGITCKIGIPFCGELAVPAEKVMNRSIKIDYRCDQFNGNLVASVFADDVFLGELSGNVAYAIPVSGGDDGTLARIGALATAAVSIATIASGAAAISAAGGASAAGSSALAGGVSGLAKSAGSFAGAQYNTYATNCNLAGSVNKCINGRGYVEYILPSTAYPYKDGGVYGKTYGYPAVQNSGKLGNFSGGYGEFDVVQTENSIAIPNATTAEKDEIIRLLAGGVIV